MIKIILLTLIFSSFVFAGAGDQGHGGDGWIDDNGRPWLYDLKEANIHKKPYFEDIRAVDIDTHKLIKNKIYFMSDEATLLLASKIKEIRMKYPALALMLEMGIEKHSWVKSEELVDILDEDPIVKLEDRKVQLAIRSNFSIFIDYNYWQQLTEQNQVALVIHELIFSWIHPEEIMVGNTLMLKQESRKVREIVRTLFTDNYLSLSIEDFKSYLKSLNLRSLDILEYQGSKFYADKTAKLLQITIRVHGDNYKYGLPISVQQDFKSHAIHNGSKEDLYFYNLQKPISDICSVIYDSNLVQVTKKKTFQIGVSFIKKEINAHFKSYMSSQIFKSFYLSAQFHDRVIEGFELSKHFSLGSAIEIRSCKSKVRDYIYKKILYKNQ